MKTLIAGILIGAGLTFSTGAMAAVSGQVTAVFKDLKIVVNGKTAELDARPLTYNGTTYLPLREVGNQFGYDVTYKADSATIELNSGATATSVKGVSSVQSTVTYGIGDSVQFSSASFTLTSGEYVNSLEQSGQNFHQTFEPKPGERIFKIKFNASISQEPKFNLKTIDFIRQITTNDGKGYKSIVVPNVDGDALETGVPGSFELGIIIKSTQTVKSIDITNPLEQNETATIQVGS